MKILAVLSLLLLCSCITREEIEVAIWKNNFNDAKGSMKELCETYPEIKDYGFYRKLNDGTLEFISVCNPHAREMLSIHNADFVRLMDRALPKKKPSLLKHYH